MKFKGRILDFKPNFINRLVNLHVELKNVDLDELKHIESLFTKEVTCELSEYHAPRSLNANKYFHLLSDQLADARRMSKSEMKNYLLYEYGQKCRDADGNLICIKTNAPVEALMQSKDFHVWYTKTADDGTPRYVLLKHSSELDSREMAILIDGVIEECKQQGGIQTLTPQKLKELKERWGV